MEMCTTHTTQLIKDDKNWPFNKKHFIILNVAMGGDPWRKY